MRKLALVMAVTLLGGCGAAEEDKRDELGAEERAAIEERIAPYSTVDADDKPATLASASSAAEPAKVETMTEEVTDAMQVADAGSADHPGAAKYTACAACHGADGGGGIGPMLKGKDAAYITGRLTAYRNNETVGEQSALMWGQAAGLSDQDIEDLAGYVETLGGSKAAADPEPMAEEPAPEPEAAAVEAAEEVQVAAASGPHPGQAKFAVCSACHGADGAGGIGPMLKGKDAAYITGRLKAYRNNETVGEQSALMWGQAAALSDEDIDDLAGYVETL